MLATISLIVSLIIGFNARVDNLTAAVRAAAPKDLTSETARDHVVAAIAAERPHVPAELLLGMAFVESHYTPTARSRGGSYCGVVQASAGHGLGKSGFSCKELQEIGTGYAAGAAGLTAWWKQCWRAKNRRRCTLRGYGGVTVNGSVSYPDRVLRQAGKIRAELAKRIRVDV